MLFQPYHTVRRHTETLHAGTAEGPGPDLQSIGRQKLCSITDIKLTSLPVYLISKDNGYDIF